MCDILIKLIVLGDSSVGKTSLLKYLIDQENITKQVPTIGVDFFTKFININNLGVKLQIWDTAGQEVFKSIISHYYKIAIGALLIFDLSSRDSFKNCEYWIKEYLQQRNYGKIILVGNKSDLSENVSEKEINVFCEKYDCNYIKCSVLKDDNLQEIFVSIAEKIILDYQNKVFNNNEEGFIIKSDSNENRLTISLRKEKNLSNCCVMF